MLIIYKIIFPTMASSFCVDNATGKSSNQLAAERLFGLQYEAVATGVNRHFCLFWNLVRGYSFDVIAMKKTDPAKVRQIAGTFHRDTVA